MCGAGKGLNQFHLLETSPSILVQLKIQICVRCVMGSFTSSVTHHSETHIIINVVMKGFKWLNVNLKGQHKKTTNRITMVATTDINSQAPIIWKQLRREPSFSLRINHLWAIKEESKVINHSMHAVCFRIVVIYIFVASDDLFKFSRKTSFANNLSEFIDVVAIKFGFFFFFFFFFFFKTKLYGNFLYKFRKIVLWRKSIHSERLLGKLLFRTIKKKDCHSLQKDRM